MKTNFSHGGSAWTSVYNEDQKRVLRAYNDSIKDGVYYLFFIDNVTDKKDGNGTMVSGYMPRGYNCGFIYDGGSPHTIAHELGHGIAGLEHVFENSMSSGKTKNLMDYASGEELWHFQWDAIQDPSRVWMKWNKDESEGEAYGKNTHYVCIRQEVANKIKSRAKYFYLPDGKIADFSEYLPSGFYIAEDGSAETSYGAVSCIRNNGYDYYLMFNRDLKNQTISNLGYGYRFIGTDTTRHVQFPITQIESQNDIIAARVRIKDKNADLFIGQDLVESYENVVCDCNMANFHELSSDDIVYETQEEEQPQVWLYDPKTNQIIIVAGIREKEKLLKFNKRSIHIDSLVDKDATCRYMTLKEFADSDYNWLTKRMQKYQNEVGQYVAIGMGVVAAVPLLVEAGPVLAQQFFGFVIRKKGKDAAIRFLTGAGTELFCALFVAYCTAENDNWLESIDWLDVCCDVVQAGGQNIVEASKHKKLFNAGAACISNVTITEIPKIFNSQDTLVKVITDCGVGAFFELLFSSEWMKKLKIYVTNLSHEQLLKWFRKKLSFVQPIDEVSIISVLGKRPEGWKNRIINVLQLKGGFAAFNFLKNCNYNYLRLSARNFERLSQIYSKIGNEQREKLQKLFIEGYDANLLILSIDQLKSSKKWEFSETVDFISDVISNKKNSQSMTINIAGHAKPLEDLREKTVTVDGKTFTQEEFMLKYHGDNISYGYLVDKRQIKLAKFDEHHNFVCEIIMDESAPKSLLTKFTTKPAEKYVKKYILDIESK